jgi:hypothetical protein
MKTKTSKHRKPYVGDGEDGARRSAGIDREEAELLSWNSDRKDRLLASAQQWEQQAYELVLQRLGERPTLATIAQRAVSEDWLAGLALVALSPSVSADAAQFTEWSRDDGLYTYDGEGDQRIGTFHPSPWIDWEAWVVDVDDRGREWSTTESGLFDLIAGITVYRRAVFLPRVLGWLGSWEAQALSIVVEWASGGNQKDQPGRLTVYPSVSAT